MNSFKLKDLLSIKNGKDHKELKDGNIPVYGSGGIMRYGDRAIYSEESILLPRKGTLSNIQYVNKPFWTVDTIYYSVVNRKLANAFYLYNYLRCLDLSGLDSGTGVPSMTFNSYYDLKVELPELSVQKQIASVLSALDSKIELNNKINAVLEAMAKLIYDYWFVQFDFPISAAQAAAMGKPELAGKPYKSSGGPMVYNQVLKREIPEGWEVGTLNDLGTIVGGSTPSKSKPENFNNSGMPWITPKDLSNNKGNKFISRGEYDVSSLGLKEASLRIMPKGTVLLSTRAPIGYLAISRFDVTTNQGFKSFIPDKNYSTPFIYHTTQSHIKVIEQNASGSTFKEISTSVLRSIRLCLPNADTHEQYTQIINPIFDKQDLLEQQNQELTSLRDWLLPMLMNGQVTIKEAEEQLSIAAEERGDYGK